MRMAPEVLGLIRAGKFMDLVARLLGGASAVNQAGRNLHRGAPPQRRSLPGKPVDAARSAGKRGPGGEGGDDVSRLAVRGRTACENLAALLKQRCGTGAVKDGRIEIPGDQRERASSPSWEKLATKSKNEWAA